ncbi:MAG TPA: shikimate dehydrogenase [Bacteroidia bacterium]|nr:shikimate dehydrogenase [Bacteroidia bacterium]
MNLGLIGKSLAHSFSPTYFSNKFQSMGNTNHSYHAYEIIEMNEQNLLHLIHHHKLNGFNVTIPYKSSIIPLLHELSDDASKIGAVNTVHVNWVNEQNIILKGYNTDWLGFLKSIRPFLTIHHQKALILGTGGASKAIQYALKTLGIDALIVSRIQQSSYPLQINYQQLNKFIIEQYKLIINTTPLGTFPEIEQAPEIPYEFLGTEHLLCDLIYNPLETAFMKKGKRFGATVLNGLSMLQFQADEAFKIWSK